MKNCNAIGKITGNDLNAVFKMIMTAVGTSQADDIVYLFKKGLLRAQMNHPCKWYEENGIIHFTLPPTEGLTGQEWMKFLTSRRAFSGGVANSLVSEERFVPTKNVVYEMAIITPERFKARTEIPVWSYFEEAQKLGYENPNLETACLFSVNDLADHFEHWGVWATFFPDFPITINQPAGKSWYFIPRGGKERVFDIGTIKTKVYWTGVAFISRKMNIIHSSNSNQKRILVVDDDDTTHLFVTEFLKEYSNIQIISAYSPEDFEKIWEENPNFNLILMDGKLKNEDKSDFFTTELVKVIREDHSTPIIAVSGSEILNEKLLECGCNHDWLKGARVEELDKLIRKIIKI